MTVISARLEVKEIQVRRTNIKLAEVQQLVAALPECKLLWIEGTIVPK